MEKHNDYQTRKGFIKMTNMSFLGESKREF